MLNNTKYKPSFKIMKPKKMSNNIEDYLSIERIKMKDLEQAIIKGE